MKPSFNFYPSRDGKYFDVGLAPLGMVAKIHGFDIEPNGIITVYKNVDKAALRKAWKEWHTKLQEQLKQLADNKTEGG